MIRAVRLRSRLTRPLLSILCCFGAHAAVVHGVAGATTVPAARDWSDSLNEARVAKGLKRVLECGRRLSPTFRDLSNQLSQFDIRLGLLYDFRSERTSAQLRIQPSEIPRGLAQVTGTIFVPLRPRSEQLGSIGHELHHILMLLGPVGRGPWQAEEIAAKRVARRITREAREQDGGFCPR